MASNSKLGAHYKSRSKTWLQRRGCTVFDMEIVRVVYTPMGMVPSKRDQLGSDLGYLDLIKNVVVFVQVKGGMTATAAFRRAAQKAFDQYRFPKHSRRELHVWRRRARAPEVIVIRDSETTRSQQRTKSAPQPRSRARAARRGHDGEPDVGQDRHNGESGRLFP